MENLSSKKTLQIRPQAECSIQAWFYYLTYLGTQAHGLGVFLAHTDLGKLDLVRFRPTPSHAYRFVRSPRLGLCIIGGLRLLLNPLLLLLFVRWSLR